MRLEWAHAPYRYLRIFYLYLRIFYRYLRIFIENDVFLLGNRDSWQRILKNDAYSTSYSIFDELTTSAPKFRF